MSRHYYRVHVVPAQPACTDRGNWLEITAANAKDAVSQARREVHNQCLYGRMDGKLIYRAVRHS